MADENTEEKKKGGILKLLMFVGGGILLVGIGLGVGFFLFGGKPADPSVEIEEIIERKMKEAEEAKAAAEAADADPDKKIAPEVENFVTTYYEFSGTFTTNLRNPGDSILNFPSGSFSGEPPGKLPLPDISCTVPSFSPSSART